MALNCKQHPGEEGAEVANEHVGFRTGSGTMDFSHSLFPGVTLRDLSSNWFHSQILEGTRPWSSAPSYQRYSAVPQLRSQVKEIQLGA